MATLYGSGKGCVRILAGLQILIGVLLLLFGIVVRVLVCHWTSTALLGIWIGVVVVITASIGLWSCSVTGQHMISVYAGLCIFCSFLSIVLCISYSTAKGDFFDELKSDTSPVDDFYSRQYVAVYMRTNYYMHCVKTARKEEIELERTGSINILKAEVDTQNKVLSEIQKHGRKGLGLAAVFIALSVLEFVFASCGVMYACTAAGWLNKKRYGPVDRSVVTVHHSRASGLL